MDDNFTGFSPHNPKQNRPYVVIGTPGRRVRVVPQSTEGSRGLFVPDGVVEGLEEGWFVPWSTTVAVGYAVSREAVGGLLPDPYLSEVIGQWKRRWRP